MTRILSLSLMTLVLAFAFNPAIVTAEDTKELRKQRQLVQKERQAQKSQRSRDITEATRTLREYTRDLGVDYREQVKELDTEFELRRVELKAEHDARVARAEAESQKKLTGLFMNPGVAFDEESIARMQADGKAFSDELFALKRQSAEELHKARIANEEAKNALLTERDRMALEEAKALGLTEDYAPILATPIGGELTTQEQRWNERENKEVIRLKERNGKLLAEFRNGETLRKWEIQNLNDDFKLSWDEKAELHAIDSQQLFYNTMLLQAVQGQQVDQQEFMSRLAEASEKKKLINIEYRKIRDKNRIKRREEKKRILRN